MHLSRLLLVFGVLPPFLFFFNVLADVDIKLKPLVDIPEEAKGDFAGFFFEPYEPTPTVERNCFDFCPCSFGDQTTCDCGVEKVCGGEFPVDLSTNEKITFHWDASSDDSKYISIKGNGRTRVEFQAVVDCDLMYAQEIRGNDIEYKVDDSGLGGTSQKYVYNPDKSFVILGKCDGCSSCEIYTRLQFDPKDGILDLNMKGLKFAAGYNPQNLLAGEHDYEWRTNGYCWIRDAASRRLNRALEGGNVYELLDLPKSDGSGASASFTLCLVITLVSIFITVVGY